MSKLIDYLKTMLEALTSGYSRIDTRNAKHGLPLETNIGRLFATFAWGLQLIDEQSNKILEWDDIDKARGSVLDRYGANFGVQREGADDAYYRLLIKVKMISMLSGGDIDTVLNAAAALFDIPVESVDLVEIFPAKIAIHVDETLLSEEVRQAAAIIVQLMKRILAAGVGFDASFDSDREFDTTAYFMTAAYIDTDIKADIVTRPRIFTNPLYFGSAAFVVSEITASPQPSNRTISREQFFNSAVYEYAEIVAPSAN